MPPTSLRWRTPLTSLFFDNISQNPLQRVPIFTKIFDSKPTLFSMKMLVKFIYPFLILPHHDIIIQIVT